MTALRATGNVLVSYEPTSDGRAALSQALSLACESGGSLTIAAVAPQERTDVGCTHCRASAARWNEEMRRVARERLTELAAGMGVPPVSIRYLTACGPTVPVLAEAAERDDVDVIVLPWRRAERLRELLRISVAQRLERRRRWQVLVAPRATGRISSSS